MDELVVPRQLLRASDGLPPAARRSNNPGRLELDDEEPDELEEQQRGRMTMATVGSSGRGRHDRACTARRLKHADQAHSAYARIESTALAGCCEPGCPFKCADVALTRNEMFQCHEISYGTTSWVSDATLQVSGLLVACSSPSLPRASHLQIHCSCHMSCRCADREAKLTLRLWC